MTKYLKDVTPNTKILIDVMKKEEKISSFWFNPLDALRHLCDQYSNLLL